MFTAQYLFSGNEVYSPWMERQADSLLAAADLVDVKGAGSTLTVEVYHKNAEDPGDGALLTGADGNIVLSSPNQQVKEWNGLKELVRYRITSDSTNDLAYDYVLFRMLAPVWFDAVKA